MGRGAGRGGLVALRRALVSFYRALAEHGMNTGSSGNVSVRTQDGMLITPSGCSAEALAAEAIVAVGLDGAVTGDAVPSSEWSMHASIYAAFPEAEWIAHKHADACTALACLNEALPAFHYMVAGFGGDDVRCAPYATFGTPLLARAAVEAMQQRTACLLANHGMIVHGRSADDTLNRAVLLETLCRQYLLARTAGTVRVLSPEEMRAAHERFRTYGPKPRPRMW